MSLTAAQRDYRAKMQTIAAMSEDTPAQRNTRTTLAKEIIFDYWPERDPLSPLNQEFVVILAQERNYAADNDGKGYLE